jgi:hypothetical protein
MSENFKNLAVLYLIGACHINIIYNHCSPLYPSVGRNVSPRRGRGEQWAVTIHKLEHCKVSNFKAQQYGKQSLALGLLYTFSRVNQGKPSKNQVKVNHDQVNHRVICARVSWHGDRPRYLCHVVSMLIYMQ